MSTNEINHPHIFKMPDVDMHIDERGAGYVFFQKIKEYRDKIIQIDGITGEEDTYKSFLQRCIRTAIVMREKGVKVKDIISICSEGRLDEVVPYFAAHFLGVGSVCFNPFISARENMLLMEQTNLAPKMLFVSTNNLDFAKAVVEKHNCEIVVFGNSTDYTPFQAFLQASEEENDFQPYEVDSSESTAIMQFSSGTTGLPKLVCISHGAFLRRIQLNIHCNDYQDRIMMFSTLHFSTSVIYWGVAVMSGNLRIVLPMYDGNKLLNLIHLYKPTLLIMGRYYSLLIKPATKDNVDVTSLKSFAIIGSALTKEQLLWLKGIFPCAKVYSGYGCTEAGAIMYPSTKTTKEVEFFQSKLMSCGTPVIGLSCKVMNPETEKNSGPNEIGELRLKSKCTASCFFNMDSSDLLDSNGWLKTGDLVYYDADGYFYVVDRLKDLIKVRGINVYPGIIDNILLSHPCVKEAVVVAKKNLIDGDQLIAVVVTRENSTVTEDEIVKFVDAKVEDAMMLEGGVMFVDSIPLTSSGKVSRYLTKKYVAEIEDKKMLVDNN